MKRRAPLRSVIDSLNDDDKYHKPPTSRVVGVWNPLDMSRRSTNNVIRRGGSYESLKFILLRSLRVGTRDDKW